jgi:hypothetical protein
MAKKPLKIKSTFNLKKLANNIDDIVADGLNLQAKYLNDSIQNGIDVGEDIDGKAFYPLSGMRLTSRSLKNQGSKILDATGNMRKTKLIRAKKGDRNPVAGVKQNGRPNKKGNHYGAFHNKGGVNELGHIVPQRKWFGITKEMLPGGILNMKVMQIMLMRIRSKWRRRGGKAFGK